MLVLSEVHERMHQIFDDLVEYETDADLVHLLDLLFVLAHREFFQLLGVLDDLVDSLLLLVLLDVGLVLVETVSDQLVDVIVVPQVDSGLVQDVGLHVVRPLLRRNSHFGETKTRNKAVLFQNLVLVDLISRVERFAKRLEFLNVPLSLSWTKSAQELELVVPVLMIHEKIDVDSDSVHKLCVDLLEMVDQSCLVDVFLQRMEIEMQSLVLAHDRAPKIQHLVEGILLESSQANGLLQDKRMVLQQLLAVVGGRKELWNFWSTPDDESLLRVALVVICHILVVVVVVFLHLILSNFEVCKLT